MKYALIGCGRISSNHVVSAINNNLEMVAFCDIVKKNAMDKIIKYELQDMNIRIYENYKEMLVKERPELVAIATESGKHAKIALDCIEAECNVIIEKPIALSIADAEA